MPTPKKDLARGQEPRKKAGKLTEQQELFCQKYLLSLNATRAAKEAGYSEHTANEQGSQLLAKLSVQERIAQLKSERNKKLDISKEAIVKLLMERVYAKLDDAMEWDNNKITLKSSKELSLRTRRNLKKIVISETKHGTDKIVELKDDGAALALLAKHVGLFDKADGADSAPRENLLDRVLGRAKSRRG
jgi:phage terminase small subunit